MNTQPWHLHVVTGGPLDKIRRGNTERNLAGVPASREIRMHGPYAGIHRERQKAIVAQLFEAMGIEWTDKERRHDWVMRGSRQFDAPVSIVVTFDRDLADEVRRFLRTGRAGIGEHSRPLVERDEDASLDAACLDQALV
jgi:hypothetical protein